MYAISCLYGFRQDLLVMYRIYVSMAYCMFLLQCVVKLMRMTNLGISSLYGVLQNFLAVYRIYLFMVILQVFLG